MTERRPRAVVVYGGWEEHQPALFAEFARETVLVGFDVVQTRDLDVLDPAHLADVDLIVPMYTFGEITPAQEAGLIESVAGGLGLLTWHGFTSAFLASRPLKFLVGGQFVAHPGGEGVTYTVDFGDDPMVAGLEPVTVTSEQYYLLVDPAVTVLATTRIVGPDMEWLKGVEMPVAWRRGWGAGRVAYCSLGHSIETLSHPSVITLLHRAAAWACRTR